MGRGLIKSLIEIPICLSVNILTDTKFWEELIITALIVVFNCFIYPLITKNLSKKDKEKVDKIKDEEIRKLQDQFDKKDEK